MNITLNGKSDRQYIIWKLNRDWPVTRYNMRNGRKLNRLSTKQLQAKLAQLDRINAKERTAYIGFLNMQVA